MISLSNNYLNKLLIKKLGSLDNLDNFNQIGKEVKIYKNKDKSFKHNNFELYFFEQIEISKTVMNVTFAILVIGFL